MIEENGVRLSQVQPQQVGKVTIKEYHDNRLYTMQHGPGQWTMLQMISTNYS